MTTETASHLISDYVVLDEFRFRRLGNFFMKRNAYDEIPFVVRYCTLSEIRDYWRKDGDAQ
jgi:hypothetical protein